MQTNTTEVRIRWLVKRDMNEVLAIENKSFEFPWTEEEFLFALRQDNCIGNVIEVDHRIVGYAIYELYSDRIEIISFAVCSWHRRKKLGSQIIDSIKNKRSLRRRWGITTRVRETNVEGQLFLRSCGFRACMVLPGHYDETHEDAFVFEYRLVPPSAEVLAMEQKHPEAH